MKDSVVAERVLDLSTGHAVSKDVHVFRRWWEEGNWTSVEGVLRAD